MNIPDLTNFAYSFFIICSGISLIGATAVMTIFISRLCKKSEDKEPLDD